MERRTTRRPFRQAGLPVLGSCCLLVHRRFLVITENSLGVMVARLMPTESPKARLEIKMVRRQASSFKRLFVLSSCECVERRRGDAFSSFCRFAVSEPACAVVLGALRSRQNRWSPVMERILIADVRRCVRQFNKKTGSHSVAQPRMCA